MHTTLNAGASARRAGIARMVHGLAVISVLAVAACGGGSDGATGPKNDPLPAPTPNPTPNPANPQGLYDLRTIDNAALPQEVYHGPWFDPENSRFYNQMVLLVTRGSVNIIANNKWAMTLDITQTLDDKVVKTTFYADGTYELQGTNVVMTPNTTNLTQIGATLDRGQLSFSLSFNGSKRDKAFAFKK